MSEAVRVLRDLYDQRVCLWDAQDRIPALLHREVKEQVRDDTSHIALWHRLMRAAVVVLDAEARRVTNADDMCSTYLGLLMQYKRCVDAAVSVEVPS